MNCSNCQNPIQDGEKFCGKCGNKIGVDNNLSENGGLPKENNKLRIFTKLSLFSNILAVIISVIIFAKVLPYFFFSAVLSVFKSPGGLNLVAFFMPFAWPIITIILVLLARTKFKAGNYVLALILSQLANFEMYMYIKDQIYAWYVLSLF